MNIAHVLSAYLTLNALLVVAFLYLRFARGRLSARSELRLHYRAIAMLFLIAAMTGIIPQRAIFEPAAKVWSSRPYRGTANPGLSSGHDGILSVTSPHGVSQFNGANVSVAVIFIFLSAVAFGVFRITRDWRRLRSIRRDSYLIRRVGTVSVFVNLSVHVPFSCWLPGRAEVILPESLTSRPLDCRIAIAHELQHHRQRDTMWVYVMSFLGIICAINPLARLWNRLLSEVQEFAVDETLVDRNKVESRQYARCLIEVAETALHLKPTLACATGMTFQIERNLLKRRIEKMISIQGMKKSTRSWVSAVLVALMAATAFASQGLVQDRRVSTADANRWAENAKKGSDFPVVVNDLVLEQLNRYVGTPEGRDFMQKALERMKNYQPAIEAKMREYQVPTELLAVPIVESGYQNLEIHNDQMWVAGIWMFIAPTARLYGLRVDEKVDERLNTGLLTDAAMRYLKGDRLRFNDWLLAVLSYNVGERALREAIEKTGSRDAWTLVRNGLKTDKDYLPRLMAAVILMRNPEAV